MNMRKAPKIILRALDAAVTALMLIFILLNLYVLAAKNINGNHNTTVFGFSAAVVLSGSMSGTIEVNDMVITHSQKEYEIGDIVMYQGEASTVTHRITDINSDGYVTKGDANNTTDGEPVQKRAVIGRVILIIPKIGNAVLFFQSPAGMLFLLIILILMIEIPSLMKRKRQRSLEGGTVNAEKEE